MHVIRSSLAAATLLAVTLPAAAEPFGPLHVTANRNQYVGKACPIDILFTATVNFTMPHPKGFVFGYHWERSDGARSPQRTARPAPHERSMVIREHWRVGKRGESFDVSETFHAGSGNERVSQASQTVHVECR